MDSRTTRLFTLAALALLAATVAVVYVVMLPPWRGIQRDRFAELQGEADAAVQRETERFEQTQATLAYRTALDAVQQAEAQADTEPHREALAALTSRRRSLEEESTQLDERLLELEQTTDADAIEALRLELVRQSGTPGVSPEELAEIEALLDEASGGMGALLQQRDAIDAELAGIDGEQDLLEAPLREARKQLAAFRAPLDRALARQNGLAGWRPGVVEFIRRDGAVERCLTCHPGMDDLASTHGGLGDVYTGWGCTVCHGGNGRSLEVESAHQFLTVRPWTMGPRYTLEPVIDGLGSDDKHHRARAAAFLREQTGRDFGFRYHDPPAERGQAIARWRDWWSAVGASYTPQEPEGLHSQGFDAAGWPETYVGSGGCLRCHESRQRRHVERWRATKFTSYERVHEVDDPGPCLRCHTTGYDEIEGSYIQPGVTCEGCHGPGSGYEAVMEAASVLAGAGEEEESQRLLDEISTSLREGMAGRNVCVECHSPFEVVDLAYEHKM